MDNVPAGWYPDPQGLADERYFDGTDWSEETRIATAPTAAVLSASMRTMSAGALRLAGSAGRLAKVADSLAVLILVLGLLGSAVIAVAALLAVGDRLHPLHATWQVALTSAAVLALNAVLAWTFLKVVAVVAEYISLRSNGQLSASMPQD